MSHLMLFGVYADLVKRGAIVEGVWVDSTV
jgi:hypothetical protein